MSRRKKIILVNLLILLVLLGLAEIGVRMFTQRNMPFSERAKANIQYEPHGLWRFQMNPSQDVLMGREGHLTDSVAYHINQWGFRGPEFPMKKPEGENRTIIIGGSHVFDVNAKDCLGNKSWPLIDNDDEGLRVINAGMPGSDTRDYPARILHDLRRFEPDYIIIMSTWNDLKWIYSYPADQQQPDPPKAIEPNPLAEKVNAWDDILGWSTIYRKLRDSYWKKQLSLGAGLEESSERSAGKTDPVEGLRQYQANLRTCVAASRAIGAKVALAYEGRLAHRDLSAEDQRRIRMDFIPGIPDFPALLTAYKQCDSINALVARNAIIDDLLFYPQGNNWPSSYVDHTHYSNSGSAEAAKWFRLYASPIALIGDY
jgi:lysophospholipase L1-like esterase